MPEQKKGIDIPQWVIGPLVTIGIILIGGYGGYSVLKNEVAGCKLNIRENKARIVSLEAERTELLEKLHNIELDVRENNTLLKEMKNE